VAKQNVVEIKFETALSKIADVRDKWISYEKFY